MSTFQESWALSGSVHILHAYSAVIFEDIWFAKMIILLGYSQTAVADFAMEEIFSSTNSTNATAITVENLFLFQLVIKELAFLTEICSKLDATILASRLYFLRSFAFQAPDFFYIKSVDLMVFLRIHLILIIDFIMAKTASEEFIAYFTFFLTSSTVMLAAIRHDFFFFFLFFLAYTVFSAFIS